MTALPDIKRGRLSPEERAEIERLASTLKNPTPSVIARRLNRHPATVQWHMIRHGLIERTVSYRERKPGRLPNGSRTNPYTPEQDARLVELRLQGKVYREIAAVLTAEFGVPRNLHSVQVRHIMLSAYDGGPEA